LGVAAEMLEDGEIERDLVKVLLNDIQARGSQSDLFDAKIRVLASNMRKLIEEEERPRSGLFFKDESCGPGPGGDRPEISATSRRAGR